MVREVPALLGQTDVKGLIKDMVEDLVELGDSFSLEEVRKYLRNDGLPLECLEQEGVLVSRR